jgi:fatty acid desaturase
MTLFDETNAVRSAGRATTATLGEVTRVVRAAGLLGTRPGYYLIKITANLLMLAVGWAAFILVGNSWWQLAVAAYLAFCFGQTDLIGHDAGHRQIFRTRRGNDVLGYLHGNLLTGVSFGWWVGHHTRHHNFPNHLSLDPDILRRQVIFDTSQRASRPGAVSRFVVRHQAWMFYLMIMLEGLRLHLAGFAAARKGVLRRYQGTELIVLTLHLICYVAVVFLLLSPGKAFAFIMVHQALFGFYMGLLFAPNHKGLPVRDGEKEELDWLTRQIYTARNLPPSRVTNFFYGGLNYQIEHHLFPSMPRSNLHHAQPLVKDFCLRHGLPYVEVSLMRSYLEVSDHLGKVSDQVRELESAARGTP